MTAANPALERLWHVRTDDGVFYDGRDTEDEANTLAKSINEKAEQLQLRTRYVVAARPA